MSSVLPNEFSTNSSSISDPYNIPSVLLSGRLPAPVFRRDGLDFVSLGDSRETPLVRVSPLFSCREVDAFQIGPNWIEVAETLQDAAGSPRLVNSFRADPSHVMSNTSFTFSTNETGEHTSNSNDTSHIRRNYGADDIESLRASNQALITRAMQQEQEFMNETKSLTKQLQGLTASNADLRRELDELRTSMNLTKSTSTYSSSTTSSPISTTLAVPSQSNINSCLSQSSSSDIPLELSWSSSSDQSFPLQTVEPPPISSVPPLPYLVTQVAPGVGSSVSRNSLPEQPIDIPIISDAQGQEKIKFIGKQHKLQSLDPKSPDLFVTVASWRSSARLLKWLIKHGAAVESATAQGNQAIHAASSCLDREAVQFLLENGASASAADRSGWQPLHFVAWNGNPDRDAALVDLLLAHRANILAPNAQGHTPEYLAGLCFNNRMKSYLAGKTNVTATSQSAQPTFIASSVIPVPTTPPIHHTAQSLAPNPYSPQYGVPTNSTYSPQASPYSPPASLTQSTHSKPTTPPHNSPKKPQKHIQGGPRKSWTDQTTLKN